MPLFGFPYSQMVYYYRDVGAYLGNSLEYLKFHSLRAIARSKAVGLPLTEVDEHSFDFISPNGCTIRLVDDDHRRCDPIFEASYRYNIIIMIDNGPHDCVS